MISTTICTLVAYRMRERDLRVSQQLRMRRLFFSLSCGSDDLETRVSEYECDSERTIGMAQSMKRLSGTETALLKLAGLEGSGVVSEQIEFKIRDRFGP